MRALGWAAPADGTAPGREEIAAAWSGIAGSLRREGLAVLQERVYAERGGAGEVLEMRRAALLEAGLDPEPAPTVVANPQPGGGICAAIHVLALRPGPGQRLRVAASGGGAHARLLESPGARALFVSDLRPPAGSREPLHALWAGAEQILAANGMSVTDLARTWIYVDELLRRYGELNAARNGAFARGGLRDGTGFRLEPPASSGIQGLHLDGSPCFMDLVALQHAGGAARPFRALHPELQCEAWSYGSAFSRGMEIDVSGRRLLTISGTASIGPDGASVHRDEPRAQILLALRNVESLLRRAGADGARGLWTLYFRDTGTWQAWRSLVSSGELLAPPRAAAIFAEICRPELAFEAEVTVPG